MAVLAGGLRALRRRLGGAEWLIVGAVALTALGLGALGFARHAAVHGDPRAVLDFLYLSLQLFALGSGGVMPPVPWQLEVARFLAPAVAGYMLVKAFAMIFRQQFERLRLRLLSGHIVVCGLGRKGALIAESFRRRGDRVVAIEKDEDNDALEPAREQGVTVLLGDARAPELLRKARVGRAHALIAVCGDDSANAAVAVQARSDKFRRRRGALTCFAQISDVHLCMSLRSWELIAGHRQDFRLEFFHLGEAAARALLARHPPFDDEGAADQNEVMVVGAGDFAIAVLAQLARRRSSTAAAPAAVRARVTLAGERAERRLGRLLALRPALGEAADLDALDLDMESAGLEIEEEVLRDLAPRLACTYVCLDDESDALATALRIRQVLSGVDTRIVVCLDREYGLAALLHGPDVGRHDMPRVDAFGILDHVCRPELLLAGTRETLARAIHEEYVRSECANGVSPEVNESLKSWADLPRELRESNRDQAAHLGAKLGAIGCDLAPLRGWQDGSFQFTADEVELLAEMEHERWVAERRREGWSHTSGVKNTKRKKSPDLVPWEELGGPEREKDRALVRGLPRFLETAGFRIFRPGDGSHTEPTAARIASGE